MYSNCCEKFNRDTEYVIRFIEYNINVTYLFSRTNKGTYNRTKYQRKKHGFTVASPVTMRLEKSYKTTINLIFNDTNSDDKLWLSNDDYVSTDNCCTAVCITVLGNNSVSTYNNNNIHLYCSNPEQPWCYEGIFFQFRDHKGDNFPFAQLSGSRDECFNPLNWRRMILKGLQCLEKIFLFETKVGKIIVSNL